MKGKNDAYLIDCDITGSDEGTSNNPLFCDQVFPRFSSCLVGLGGAGEGLLPSNSLSAKQVGDNAGPHVDEAFQHNCANDFCLSKVWEKELQTAQMPHRNNLDDLAIFSMKMHVDVPQFRTLLKLYSNLQVHHEEIWCTAEEIAMGKLGFCRDCFRMYPGVSNCCKCHKKWW